VRTAPLLTFPPRLLGGATHISAAPDTEGLLAFPPRLTHGNCTEILRTLDDRRRAPAQ